MTTVKELLKTAKKEATNNYGVVDTWFAKKCREICSTYQDELFKTISDEIKNYKNTKVTEYRIYYKWVMKDKEELPLEAKTIGEIIERHSFTCKVATGKFKGCTIRLEPTYHWKYPPTKFLGILLIGGHVEEFAFYIDF